MEAAFVEDVRIADTGEQIFDGESKSWRFNTDPIFVGGNGVNFASLGGMLLTLYRAPHAGGGYDAYVTLTGTLVSLGWTTSPTIVNPRPGGGYAVSITLLNGQGGGLLQVNSDLVGISCNQSAPFFFKSTMDPDIYDICVGARLVPLTGYSWLRC